MTVVSDTSPLLYLLLIDQLDLLPRLYKTIAIPDAVQNEMQAEGAPEILKSWIGNPPDWLDIYSTPTRDVAALQNLQIGEQAAILLAQQLQADLLILDDLAARKAAQQLDLSIIGMLGILGEAARRQWIDLPDVLNHLLQDTNFRVSPQLIQDVLGQFS